MVTGGLIARSTNLETGEVKWIGRTRSGLKYVVRKQGLSIGRLKTKNVDVEDHLIKSGYYQYLDGLAGIAAEQPSSKKAFPQKD